MTVVDIHLDILGFPGQIATAASNAKSKTIKKNKCRCNDNSSKVGAESDL